MTTHQSELKGLLQGMNPSAPLHKDTSPSFQDTAPRLVLKKKGHHSQDCNQRRVGTQCRVQSSSIRRSGENGEAMWAQRQSLRPRRHCSQDWVLLAAAAGLQQGSQYKLGFSPFSAPSLEVLWMPLSPPRPQPLEPARGGNLRGS